ncbi:unnamed protein product [Trichobilharzia regenti]|nr:unnamed protein product [Trichobilharzia regenti]
MSSFSGEFHNFQGFKAPKRPFKRLKYVDAIAQLNSLGITKEDLTPFQFGDEITEIPERQLVSSIGEPVLVTHFPTSLKVFYMLRTEGDRSLTDSVSSFFFFLTSLFLMPSSIGEYSNLSNLVPFSYLTGN